MDSKNAYEQSVVAVDDDGYILCSSKVLECGYVIKADEAAAAWIREIYVMALKTQQRVDAE